MKIYKHHILSVMAHKHKNYGTFVTNIPNNVNEEMLKAFFENYGVVKYLKKMNQTSAFVDFADEETRIKVGQKSCSL